MSYNLDIISCPNIQGDLTTAFSCVAPIEQLPLTEFVFSDFNLNTVLEMNIAPGNGKKRIVELVFTPRKPETMVSDTVSFDCAATDEEGQLSATYEIDTTDGVKTSEKFTVDRLAEMCKDNGVWFAERIIANMDVLLRRMETRLHDKLAGLTGKFATNDVGTINGGRTLKTVSTRDANGKIDLNFWEEIRYSTLVADFCATPVVFGEGELTKAVANVYAGCCADYGVDIAEFAAQNPFVYFHSNRMTSAFGSNHFAVLNPGTVQPIWYNRFVGKNGINEFVTDTYQQTVMRDPRFGIPFDYTMKVDCGVVTIELGLAFDLVGLPSDLYDVSDRLNGVNGVLEFAISN